MYKNDQLVEAYRKYCETGTQDAFNKFLAECKGLVEFILQKYPAFREYWEDIEQEVLLKIWKHLRSPRKLLKFYDNPLGFLYMRIWPYVYQTLSLCAEQYGVSFSISSEEKFILALHDDCGVSFRDIAKMLNVAERSAKTLCSATRRKLKVINTQSLSEINSFAIPSDELDPATLYEIREEKEKWVEQVLDKLATHPVYKKDAVLLNKVKKAFLVLVEENIQVNDNK